MKEQIRFELEFIISGEGLLQSFPEMEPAAFDLDDKFIENISEIRNQCHDYFAALPEIFSPPEREPRCDFILQPGALNAEHILIDPESHRIAEIINWEMTSVLPKWIAQDYPSLLCELGPLPTEADVTKVRWQGISKMIRTC
jgi:hypothetical protein